MANTYWVAGAGNWSDNAAHWSLTSGGAAGAALPTSADVAIFDASSGSGTVIIDMILNISGLNLGFASITLINTVGHFAISIGIGHFTQSAGIFNAGASTITLLGNW